MPDFSLPDIRLKIKPEHMLTVLNKEILMTHILISSLTPYILELYAALHEKDTAEVNEEFHKTMMASLRDMNARIAEYGEISIDWKEN
ncbi:MAG: hypothetical protein ABR936_11440 [Bacteroidota bacterium]|jgi:hypothetical protein